MTIVGYPSQDFPPPSAFTLDIPDEWLAIHVPGPLLAVHKNVDGFRPNVLVTWSRAPATRPDESANGTAEAEDEAETQLLHQLRESELEAEDGTPVNQIQLLVLGPPRGRTRDRFNVVGTYGRDEPATTREEILGIIQSFRVRLD